MSFVLRAWENGPPGRGAGAAIFLLVVLLLPSRAGGAEPVAHSTLPTPSSTAAVQDAQNADVDTIQTRADSIRARVIERARGGRRAANDTAAADTIADAARDTGQAGERVMTPARADGRPQDGVSAARRVDLPASADTVMRALSRLPGYEIAVYEGTRADFEARARRLVLRGDSANRAVFSGQGARVEADSTIAYDDAQGLVRTTGPTTLVSDQGDPVESESLVYSVQGERGTAPGARTTYSEGDTWYVRGNLDSVERGRLFGSDARFTTCELENPHTHFQARDLKVVHGQVLVARGVRMFVEDVPILWLPFIAQNLGSGRASGLLTPSVSMNDVVRTSSGYNRRISNIGYYWAMSDYSDMTVALDWFSNQYTAITTGLRYNWRRQFLDGRLNLRQYWREEGGREFAMDTQHGWVISERTRANVSGRFVTSSDFVTQNSFDPREVTQTIDSNAGLSRRFDWGNLSLTANRRQYLTDDRVDMTLPSLNLSLSTVTLFAAPPSSASWYNNLSLGGGMRLQRDSHGRGAQPDTAFQLRRADEIRTQASAQTSMGLGNFNVSAQGRYTENVFADVPGSFFPGADGPESILQMGGFSTGDGLPPGLDPFLDSDLQEDPLLRDDFSTATLGWSASVGYRQSLIGSTTMTPRVSVSGELQRSDSIPEALSMVSGPIRVSTGVALQTDLYGFYPGIGEFEGIRHKITPSASFDYSPSVSPTALQEAVFGARVSRPRKIVTFGFNQTWEARRPATEEGEEEEAPEEEIPGEEELFDPFQEEAELGELGLPGEDLDPDERETAPLQPSELGDEGLERAPRADVVNLLALNTTSVTYDVVEADSTGEFLRGFQTTRLSNTVRSDYLRGLDLSFEHELFEDPPPGEGEQPGAGRRFAPHLSRVSLGFQLDHRSSLVRTLTGLVGLDAEEPDEPEAEPEAQEELPEGEVPTDRPDGFDESQIVPGGQEELARRRREGWNARFSYSLRRPRETSGPSTRARAQMLQWTLSFAPTLNWDATWRSSYDLEARRFNDHMVSLRRDLHEWEASFGFRQTTTGNWAFTFNVSLRANSDLGVDWEQRSTDGRRRPVGGF